MNKDQDHAHQTNEIKISPLINKKTILPIKFEAPPTKREKVRPTHFIGPWIEAVLLSALDTSTFIRHTRLNTPIQSRERAPSHTHTLFYVHKNYVEKKSHHQSVLIFPLC